MTLRPWVGSSLRLGPHLTVSPLLRSGRYNTEPFRALNRLNPAVSVSNYYVFARKQVHGNTAYEKNEDVKLVMNKKGWDVSQREMKVTNKLESEYRISSNTYRGYNKFRVPGSREY